MAKPFTMHYRTYDTAGGYGSPREWRAGFQATMGLDEARGHMRGRGPHVILGIASTATVREIKSAYRQRSMACHPDRCLAHGLSPDAAHRAFVDLHAAYLVMMARQRG